MEAKPEVGLTVLNTTRDGRHTIEGFVVPARTLRTMIKGIPHA